MPTKIFPRWLSPIASAAAAAVLLGETLPLLAPSSAWATTVINGCNTGGGCEGGTLADCCGSDGGSCTASGGGGSEGGSEGGCEGEGGCCCGP